MPSLEDVGVGIVEDEKTLDLGSGEKGGTASNRNPTQRSLSCQPTFFSSRLDSDSRDISSKPAGHGSTRFRAQLGDEVILSAGSRIAVNGFISTYSG